MTVKEVFELRKQGKIEEAYEVIRPMYAVHQGKYTTLCMFWMLLGRDNPKAAYELQKCIAARKAQGFGVTKEMQQMLQQLTGVQPATDAEQHDFYRKMTEKFRSE